MTPTPATALPRNVDHETVASFGAEWETFHQAEILDAEAPRYFEEYFAIFPWEVLGKDARGFDLGCGSGRWARFVAPKVGHLTCIDPSPQALAVARLNLREMTNVEFHNADADTMPLGAGTQDFGYSLGVLHHIPDTAQALRRCTALLKTGAPFLLYIYYRFDNRPKWFAALWRLSDVVRRHIASRPNGIKTIYTNCIAAVVYWPLAKIAWCLDRAGLSSKNFPLAFYRNSSFYTMRTDARDRFGTPLEQRFTRDEIEQMMRNAGLDEIRFSDAEPYWCAVGTKV